MLTLNDIPNLFSVFQMSELTKEMSRRDILFALYSVEDLDKMSMDIKVSYSILNGFSVRNEETVDFLVLCRQHCVTTVMKEVLFELY